jgi:hypothetical protein
VAFIVRPEKFDPETDQKGVGILYVEKHRDGEPGLVSLKFDGPRTCFAASRTAISRATSTERTEGNGRQSAVPAGCQV